VAGTEQIEEVQPALRGARAEPGEPLIANLRAKRKRFADGTLPGGLAV
jgi:hypothetical protein